MENAEREFITGYIRESCNAVRKFSDTEALQETIAVMAAEIAATFKKGGKILIAGNGGSAGDAQHMAGEFVSRLFFDHAPLPAIALTTDTSVITAVGNDYGYEKVFERQVLGLGRKGDVFLGISTSGKSPNIIKALEAAKIRGLTTLGFAGEAIGPMDALCDHILHMPSLKTAVIQQLHITAVHLVCGLVEKAIFA